MNHDVLEVARQSSAVIQESFRSVRQLLLERAGKVSFSEKGDGSPVTDTDIEVERIVIQAVKEQFPSLVVVGEESGYDPGSLPKTCWLIDPIDGTDSFVENSGAFTCMAVLIHDEEALASIIYSPTDDTMYTAFKGNGAFKDTQRLDLTANDPVLIGLCKGRFIEPLNNLFSDIGLKHQTVIHGGGYGTTLLLDGKASAIYKLISKGHIHDYATGALLIAEAGGVLLPVLEDEYTFRTRSFIACHPDLAPAIKQHMDDIRALEDPTKTAL